MKNIDLIIDALSVAQNSVWSTLNQEALAYAIELKRELNNFKPPFELTDAGAETNIDPFTLYPKGSGMVTLNQPDQKPVAWMYKGNFHDFDPSEWASPKFVVTPLYTAPPCKKWVGLTDNEMFDAMDSYSELENGRKIEQLLKDKNT